MTRDELEARINERESEKQQIIEADKQSGAERDKQFAVNLKRVTQLEGAISELKALLEAEPV